MDISTYQKMTLAEMGKRRWVLARDVERRDGTIVPGGTRIEITKKHNGLWVRSQRCESCGVQASIGRLSPIDVKEVADVAVDLD